MPDTRDSTPPAGTAETLPRLSVVVIGRNEEANLDRCFASVRNMSYPGDKVELIYVDSHSSDRSRDIARRWGAEVVALNAGELGAARAREAGRRKCTAPHIFFLDGDCAIDPDFVRRALPEFREPRVACVFGAVRERDPGASFHHRANDLLWKGFHLGEGPLRGGNYLARREALEAAGGYNTRLLTMENVELGARLVRRGFINLRIAVPMAAHDLGRVGWRDFLRRWRRAGYGNLIFFTNVEQALRSFRTDAEFLLQVTNSTLFVLAALAGAAVLLLSARWFPLWLAVAPPVLLLTQLWWVRKKSRHWPTLARYAFYELARSLAVLTGHVWFFGDRICGRVRFPVDWR